MATLKTEANAIRVGSPDYMSPNAHQRNPQTEIDDLVSLGYVFIELSCGKLPWINLPDEEVLTRKLNWDAVIVSKFKKIFLVV